MIIFDEIVKNRVDILYIRVNVKVVFRKSIACFAVFTAFCGWICFIELFHELL
jgi:hypothetical protein